MRCTISLTCVFFGGFLVCIVISCTNAVSSSVIDHKPINSSKRSTLPNKISKSGLFMDKEIEEPNIDNGKLFANPNVRLFGKQREQKFNHGFVSTKREFDVRLDPDVNRNLTQLIASQGYPVETFTVQTLDNFLLDLHRIPHERFNVKGHRKNKEANTFQFQKQKSDNRKNMDGKNPRPVVFLQHGYMSSACDFTMNFANDSLAFVLADAGYDVWLGNSRGNTYSRRHLNLKPDDNEFWDWSFDQMALNDTPAFLDFILNKTGQPSLYYIGHSQGTLIGFALLSQKPEFQQKIKLFVALAPIISLAHMKSPMKYFANVKDSSIYGLLGRGECFTNDYLTKLEANTICANSATRWMCYELLFLTNGPDLSNLNETRLPVYMSHTPAGTSVQNVVHYAQMVREKRFAMYDFGSSTENTKHYGQPTPPEYRPRNVTVPSLLFTAGNDWLADTEDVSILEATLPNIVGKYNYSSWNHMDFVLGMDAAKVCYREILKWLPKY